MGHADDNEDYYDPKHEKLYQEFVQRAVDVIDDDELEDSPMKGIETEEEKKEKLIATGSRETEKKLEEVKQEIRNHNYNPRGGARGGARGGTRGGARGGRQA
jgi:hypothetical protein